MHDDVSNLLKDNLLPYTIVEDPERKTVAVKTQKGDVVSAEALVVSSCSTDMHLMSSSAIQAYLGCTVC